MSRTDWSKARPSWWRRWARGDAVTLSYPHPFVRSWGSHDRSDERGSAIRRTTRPSRDAAGVMGAWDLHVVLGRGCAWAGIWRHRAPDDMRMMGALAGFCASGPVGIAEGQFGYARRLRYVFFDEGSRGDVQALPGVCAGTRTFRTLAEKRKDNPHVDLLIGRRNGGAGTGFCSDCQEMQAAGSSVFCGATAVSRRRSTR